MKWIGIALLMCFQACAQGQAEQASSGWRYSKWENPMYAKDYDQFVLKGRYLRAPELAGSNEPPSLTLHCSEGKFRSGEFNVGAAIEASATRSLKGAPQAEIEIRLDSGKVKQDWWEYSNNGKTLFFDHLQFVELMTGRLLGHPSRTSGNHQLILGVIESLNDQVVAEFDMPAASPELISSCGLEWGKLKRLNRAQ